MCTAINSANLRLTVLEETLQAYKVLTRCSYVTYAQTDTIAQTLTAVTSATTLSSLFLNSGM